MLMCIYIFIVVSLQIDRIKLSLKIKGDCLILGGRCLYVWAASLGQNVSKFHGNRQCKL